jgi:hypothetical protein
MVAALADTLAEESDDLAAQTIVSASTIYVGIDVACAVGKRLPICVVSSGHSPVPLNVPDHLAAAIPEVLGTGDHVNASLPSSRSLPGR